MRSHIQRTSLCKKANEADCLLAQITKRRCGSEGLEVGVIELAVGDKAGWKEVSYRETGVTT